MQQIEHVLEALLALEVELGVVRPDVFADLDGEEEVEHGSFALHGIERGGKLEWVVMWMAAGVRGGGGDGEWEGIGGVGVSDEGQVGWEIR